MADFYDVTTRWTRRMSYTSSLDSTVPFTKGAQWPFWYSVSLVGDEVGHDALHDDLFVRAVRAAATATYQRALGQSPQEVYLVLAYELQQRGIVPDPEAVYEGAVLMSRGRKPAVLRGHGTGRRHAGPDAHE